jgi:hypothetical protein
MVFGALGKNPIFKSLMCQPLKKSHCHVSEK